MRGEIDPLLYPQYFELEGDRIIYKRTGHGGRPKSYIWSDKEEKVRAWFYVHLIETYKYPVERIDLEVEVFRRKPEDFADIVVYEDDALISPYLVVECKAGDISAAEREQAIKQCWGLNHPLIFLLVKSMPCRSMGTRLLPP